MQRRVVAEREAHTVICQLDACDVGPVDWWSDLRRGRLRGLGGTFRTIDVLKEQGRQDLAVTLARVVLDYAMEDDAA